MRQIRRGTFETNSSSQHSLVIRKESTYYTPKEIMEDIYLWKDGVWDLSCKNIEFERRPFNILGTFEGKFRYFIANFTDLGEYATDTSIENYKKLKDIAREVIPELINIKLDLSYGHVYKKEHKYAHRWFNEEQMNEFINKIVEVYEPDERQSEHIGFWDDFEDEWYSPEDCWEVMLPSTGYCSDSVLTTFLNKHPEVTWKEFLTNKKYIIITDGDEYGDWSKLKATGIIDTKSFEYEFPSNEEEE